MEQLLESLRALLTASEQREQAQSERLAQLEQKIEQLQERVQELANQVDELKARPVEVAPVVEPAVEPVIEPEPEPIPEPIPEPAPEKSKLEASMQIADLRKGMSIGDRFLFQRELFGGNGETMNCSLEELNALGSLDEAMQYVARLGWDMESQAAQLFLALLKRRW